MRKLLKGILDFRKNQIEEYRKKYSNLVKGQKPDTLMIACCDSRVVPNTFASSDPGDLFVLRNIGNLVPPCPHNHQEHNHDFSVAATLEFAVKVLQIKDIIICGHSECGAMEAIIEGANNFNYVDDWLQFGKPSYKRYLELSKPDELSEHNHLSQVNAVYQQEHLSTYSFIRESVQKNKLKIHSWWFDLETANVLFFDPKIQKYKLIEEEDVKELIASSHYNQV